MAKKPDWLHLIMYGIIGSVSLTVFLFNLTWTEVSIVQEDVSVVKEDVAYIRGQLDRYWGELP